MLVPRSHKKFIEPTAQKLGVDPGVVDDVVSFYWSELRRQLTTMSHHNINVYNLGTFHIKHWKVDEYLATYRKFLDKANVSTFKGFGYKREMEEQYQKLLRLKAALDLEENRKLVKIEERNEYAAAKSLEQQEEDSRGYNQ
jgi:hypothetical protein